LGNNNLESLKLDAPKIAMIALPTITIVVFLFYFLRVALGDMKSIQSQILQIELRMTLCQFIQNYAEQSKALKEQNKEGFEKFESLIFSSIVSSDEKIPATFDGVEQLAFVFFKIKMINYKQKSWVFYVNPRSATTLLLLSQNRSKSHQPQRV
jgi:hypothetical protein